MTAKDYEDVYNRCNKIKRELMALQADNLIPLGSIRLILNHVDMIQEIIVKDMQNEKVP